MNGGTEMYVREKLIEILRKPIFPHELVDPTEAVADYLLDNGVTVQEWVSTKDRLPEISEGWAETPEPVLYMMKNTKTIYAGYYGEGGVWRDKYFRQYSDSRNGVDADDVLCWMYQHDLPQPPKGE